MQTTSKPVATVATNAPVAAQQTVVQPATLRAARIAKIQVALLQQRIAAKQARSAAVQLQYNNKAFMLQVQQLAAQYGLPVPNTLSVRAVATPQKHPASAQSGACKQVHAIAAANAYNRAATLAACKAAGINPATAATQYALAKKQHMQVQ